MVQPTSLAAAVRAPVRTRNHFFTGFAVTVAILVLIGFSRTFFAPLARHTFTAPWFVYVHGALFFTWTGFVVLQSFLVATRRTQVHRRLGTIAFVLIPLMVSSGVAVAFWSSIRDLRTGNSDAVVAFFFGELMDMALFLTLAALAVLLRRNVQAHKRLILLATLAILGAAVGRIRELGELSKFIPTLLLFGVVLYDLRTRASLHAATVWGGTLLMVGAFIQPVLGNTQWWLTVGARLLRA